MDTQEPTLPLRAEALLSQADWVRALVRGLGVRESDADDVVQATWVAALTSPPRAAAEGPGLRAWVARVARNFALKRVGGDQRRASHERDGARQERLPSAADVVEREEARAEVVRALLDVQEPYRTTLLLRFYEGLEPREIARRQDVPDSTVRNRLKRGLAFLRERLESTQGTNWRQRCVLVLPLLHSAPQGPVWLPKWAGAGSALASAAVVKTVGVAAAVVLVAGGLTFVLKRAGPVGAVSSTTAPAASAIFSGHAEGAPGAATEMSAGSQLAALGASGASGAREPASAAAVAGASVDDTGDAARFVLHGTLRNSDGSPLKLSGVPASLLARTFARTEFRFEAGVRLDQPQQNAHTDLVESLDVVDRRAADESAVVRERAQAVIELPKIRRAVGNLTVDRSSADVESDKVQEIVFGMEDRLDSSDGGRVVIASKGGDAREVSVDAEGRFEIGDLRPDHWRLYASAPGHMARRMEFDVSREEQQKELDVTLPPTQTLRVKMLTPDGRNLLEVAEQDAALGLAFTPVPFATREAPGSRIADLGENWSRIYGAGQWRDRSQTDEKVAGDAAGVLMLEESLPLHVGVSVRGVVLDERVVTPGSDEVVFVVPIERLRAVVSTVTVHVVSAQDGLPIAHAEVLIEGCESAISDARGVAEIPRVPPGERMIHFDADGVERLAEWISIEPGSKLDLGSRELGQAARVTGHLVDENGTALVGSVQLRSLDGRAAEHELPLVQTADTDDQGKFAFEQVGRRRYVLQVGGDDWAAALTTIDARSGSVSDVAIQAEHCGELKLTFPIEPRPDSCYVVEAEGDATPVSVQACAGWHPFGLRLANGTYRVRLVDGARSLWVRHVVIAPGTMMAFDDPTIAK
ncbi:MAG TPA: sigma-70 family RNA polymerase sigma factor [Planctomycetota bacterium]|jgi:RNA polymerase sigma-70 factor (ECF subfamily)|nr:sigma-70 family RNA polymerase sigma factor [Planctomycetota bacterium]